MRTAFLLLLVQLPLALFAQDDIPIKEGLVGGFTFSNEVNDASGREMNSDLAQFGADRHGVANSSLSLEGGKETGVSLPHDESTNLRKAISISAWVYPTRIAQTTHQHTILSKMSQLPGTAKVNGYELEIQDGYFVFETSSTHKTSQYREYRSKHKLSKNTWYHLCATFDGEIISLYINGKKDTIYTREHPISSNEYPVTIGTRSIKNSREMRSFDFVGLVDDVFLYNRKLSSTEIAKLAKTTHQHTPIEVEGDASVIISGVVIDNGSKKNINAKLEFYEDDPEQTALVVAGQSKGYKIELERKHTYYCRISSDGYLSNHFEVPLAHIGHNSSLTKDFILKPIELNKEIIMEHILFHRGTNKFVHSSFKELNELASMLEDNPTVQIELGGHSDNQGEESLNVKLSVERVQSVINYLIEKGIESDRLTAKGYGSSSPVASNDDEATRKLNRRVEFKITKY